MILKDYLYYQDDAGEIYCGDCLEIMPLLADKSIDLVLTDPPYGLNYHDNDLCSNQEKLGGHPRREIAEQIINDGEEAHDIFQKLLREAKRVLKIGGCCCCCCCGGGPQPLFARWTLWMDEIIGFKQAVVWDKNWGIGMQYRRTYEFVLIAQNGNPSLVWNGGRNTRNVIRIPLDIGGTKIHPNEKPVNLMSTIIGLHSNETDLILDPFLGSGTTAVACKRLNRRFIGIEISEKYCEIAKNRLQNEVEPLFKK